MSNLVKTVTEAWNELSSRSKMLLPVGIVGGLAVTTVITYGVIATAPHYKHISVVPLSVQSVSPSFLQGGHLSTVIQYDGQQIICDRKTFDGKDIAEAAALLSAAKDRGEEIDLKVNIVGKDCHLGGVSAGDYTINLHDP